MIDYVELIFYWTGAFVWILITILLVLLCWYHLDKWGVIILMKNLFYLPIYACMKKEKLQKIYNDSNLYWARNNKNRMVRIYFKVMCWRLDIKK